MPYDLTTGVVRILKADDSTAGTGFVASDEGLIGTCVHVVEACGAGPGERVRLVFQASGTTAEAEVLADGWHPEVDVAFLRLVSPLPEGVAPATLGPSVGREGARVRAFGYPEVGEVEGLWGDGRLVGRVTEARRDILQLQSTQITVGFSGGPVWEEETGQVVGMVTQITTPDRYDRLSDVAFAVPAETLRDLRPQELELQPASVSLPSFIPSAAPAPPPHFTGRQADLDALAQMLTANDTRQVTIALLGMGGIGKTALAIQLAVQMHSDFPGGIFWADLSVNSGDPLPVLANWARLCGHDVSSLPDPQARAQVVRGILARRVAGQGRSLMILDDVREEWLDGVRVLQSARPPGVPQLLTTRDEELALTLSATIHRLGVLAPEQSVKLLATLAGPVVEREPDAARRLAEQVGYLPLALELAGKLAALRGRRPNFRLESLCEQVKARMVETLRLKGQRGLVACFSLSYEALAPEEQRLFRALGAFAPAPFSAEHVAAVLQGERGRLKGYLRNLRERLLGEQRVSRELQVDPDQVDQITARLDAMVALSLVNWVLEEGEHLRYSLHPLLYEYAATLLEEAGEGPSIHTAHAAHYLAYAEAHDQSTSAGYDALEAERSNILVAMDRAYLDEQWKQVRRFMWALEEYLDVRGYWDEHRARLEQAIKAARADDDGWDTANFLQNLGILTHKTGNLTEAQQLHRQSLDIKETLGERASIAGSLHELGMVAQDGGNFAEARRLFQQSLDIKRELGAKAGIAKTLHQLGRLAQETGEYAEARQLYQQSLAIEEELGDREGVAASLHQLGNLAYDTEDNTEARRLYQQSLDIAEELGHRAGIASSMHALGMVAQDAGDYAEARRLYQQSLDIAEALGDQKGIANSMHQLGTLAQDIGDDDAALRLYQQGLDIAEQMGDRAGVAAALHQMGTLAHDRGDYEKARQLHQQSLDIKEKLADRVGIASSLYELGLLARDTGDLVEARRLNQQSLDIAEELGDQAGVAQALGALGRLAHKEGDAVKAEELYQQAVKTQQEIGDVVSASFWMFNLARLYKDQGRPDEALPLLEQAVEIAEQAGSSEAEHWRDTLEQLRRKLEGQ